MSLTGNYTGLFSIAIIIVLILVWQIFKFLHDKSANVIMSLIDRMPGRDFEIYIHAVLVNRGYTAVLTQASHDNGADVVIPGVAVIQCKRYNRTISEKAIHDVQRANGKYRCRYKVIITNRNLSDANNAKADKKGIIVVDRKKLKRFIKGDTKIIFRR